VSRDVDAVVAGNGEEAARRLSEALGVTWFRLGGDRFAAYRLEGEGFHLDVWDREETTVTADLRRRDLTVNSIALRLDDFELIDPFGGLEDLGRKRLRATSETSFSEDPLRVLRLARFTAHLGGFSPTERTIELARSAAAGLDSVAPERVREELRSAFGAGRIDRGLVTLDRLGLYPRLWSCREGAEPPGEPPFDRLRQLTRRATDLGGQQRVDLFLASQAALLSELPRGEARLRALCERRWLANRDARDVLRLLEWNDLPSNNAERRWLLHRAGELWPTLAAHLGSAVSDRLWRQSADALLRLVEEEADVIFTPPPLLDGTQIAELLEMDPGPLLGEAVAALRRAQIEGRVDSPEAAARFLRDRARRP
jgi:tRNA nucleotidyltransferase/poly(A) polymerase